MPPSHSPRVFTAAKNMPVPPGGPTNDVATPTPASTRMARFTLPRRRSDSMLGSPAASAARLSFSSTSTNCATATTMKNIYALISQANGDDQWKNSSVPSECRMAPRSMPMNIIDTTSDTTLNPSAMRATGAKRGILSR